MRISWGKTDTKRPMSTGHEHAEVAGNHSAILVTRLEKDSEVRRLLHRYERLDDTYDLPYLAGYSKDGKIIYIDRHLPEQLSYHHDGKFREYRPRPFIIDHESFEKAVIDALSWKYAHAHQAATGYERRAVLKAGLIWQPYQEAYRPYIKADEHEKLKRVPADLDLTPYLDDPRLLARMKKVMH
jgi:hypothetical protein